MSATGSPLVLEVDDVVVRGDGGFFAGPVRFALARGESVAIVGTAGAGKSLLLAALVGLVPLHKGAARVLGVELGPRSLPAVRSEVGYCFQRDALLDDESALENVRIAVRARGLDDVDHRAADALRAVGLHEAGDKLPAELSGGMRKRLGVARALACAPALFLGDAVTAGLDPSTAAEVLHRVMERVRATQMAAVLATHDVDAVLPLVERVLVLEEGAVRYAGPVAGLKDAAGLEAFVPITRRSAA